MESHWRNIWYTSLLPPPPSPVTSNLNGETPAGRTAQSRKTTHKVRFLQSGKVWNNLQAVSDEGGTASRRGYSPCQSAETGGWCEINLIVSQLLLYPGGMVFKEVRLILKRHKVRANVAKFSRDIYLSSFKSTSQCVTITEAVFTINQLSCSQISRFCFVYMSDVNSLVENKPIKTQ